MVNSQHFSCNHLIQIDFLILFNWNWFQSTDLSWQYLIPFNIFVVFNFFHINLHPKSKIHHFICNISKVISVQKFLLISIKIERLTSYFLLFEFRESGLETLLDYKSSNPPPINRNRQFDR